MIERLPPIAILAGGLATRLKPLTDKIPKALIEVAGRPFIDHLLQNLSEQGVTKVVLCTGLFGDQLESHVGDGSHFNLQVRYSNDGPVPLGTGGALLQALPLLGNEFFVTYGDTFLDIAYPEVFQSFKNASKSGLMTVLENQNQWGTSNTEFSRTRGLIEHNKRAPTPRMHHIDYGLSLLTRQSLENWHREHLAPAFDLNDLFTDLSRQQLLAGFEVKNRFYEIGTPQGLKETTQFLTERSERKSPMTTQLRPYIENYFQDAAQICSILNQKQIPQMESMIQILREIRSTGGRLFILGVGGSAGNATHAVNDFRKIVGIETYAPTDNVSELTARINDDGWNTVFANWLMGSRLSSKDGILVFSVGGGNEAKNVSMNIVMALKLAQERGAKIMGIVGRDGGFTAKVADACVIVPTINGDAVTPHAEAFQAVVWHMLVSHPALKANEMKWESTETTQVSPDAKTPLRAN